MSDVVEFLRARLDEDERIARAAIADDGGQDGGFEDAMWLDDRSHPLTARIAKDAANLIRATAVPRRVLAEVDAKRRRIEDYLKVCELADPVKHPDQAYVLAKGALERTLTLNALPYADHPDYDEAWRVDVRPEA